MLVNPIDVTLFTFWSDGTYKLKFSCETSKEECIALLENGDYVEHSSRLFSEFFIQYGNQLFFISVCVPFV